MNKNQLQRRKRRKEEKERKGKKNYEEENKSIFIKLKISLLSKLNHSLSEHRGKKERERECGYVEEKFVQLFSFFLGSNCSYSRFRFPQYVYTIDQSNCSHEPTCECVICI